MYLLLASQWSCSLTRPQGPRTQTQQENHLLTEFLMVKIGVVLLGDYFQRELPVQAELADR